MSPIPDLPPITEDATLDASEYVAALEAMAEAASKAAAAMGKVTAALAAQQELMDSMAAGAAEAAAAEDKLAEAEQNVAKGAAAAAAAEEAAAKGAAGLTAALGAEAAAVRDLAIAWTEEAAAEAAAAAAAEAFGRDVARSATELEAFMGDRLHASMQNLEQDLYITDHSAEQSAVAFGHLAMAYRDAFASVDPMTQALDQLRENFNLAGVTATDMADYTEGAFRVMGQGATTAANTAGRAWAIQIGWLRLTGTTLHWLIAGTAEFLAVFIPAMVAGGAAAAVMAQGAQDVQTHLSAMYAAQEATANIFHQTIGTMLGMGHALQSAQNAADPKVFELLGAGINVAKTASGQFVSEGSKVVGVLDNFAAKVVADMQGAFGAKLHDLLGNGVNDLTAFGQVLGNVGHAVLNLASDMPGLAGVLLGIVDGASRLLSIFSGMPGIIITAAMAFEEINRWGSLAVGVLGRLTGATVNLQGGFFSLTRFGSVFQNLASVIVQGVGAAVAGIGSLTTKLGSLWIAMGTTDGEIDAMDAQFLTMGASAVAAGTEISGAGAAIKAFAATITPLQAAVGIGLVAGIGALYYEMITAKTGAQQLAASMQQAADAANGMKVFSVIAGNVDTLNTKLAQANQTAHAFTTESSRVAEGVKTVQINTGLASRAADTYHQSLTQQQRDLVNVTGAIGYLSRVYGTTFVGALALAQAAGVHLASGITGTGQAATDARIKIANYVAGMNAMGAKTSTVGHDVTLLGIASALASTRVQQLQQAFSGFVDNMAGGTSNLVAMNSQLRQMGTLTQEGLQRGSQAWQNFDSTLTGSASQLVQWFQLAGTEGAVGAQKFTAGIQDIVAGMVQVASKTPASRAELVGFANAAGLSAKNFPDLVRQLNAAGASGKGLAAIVSQVTGHMANMNSVARALGSSLGSSVVAAMNNARVSASNLGQAAQNFVTAWNHVHTINASVIAGFRGTATALVDVYHSTSMAKTAVDALAQQMGLTRGQITTLNSLVPQFASHASSAASATGEASSHVSDLNGKFNELNSEISGAAGKIQTAGDQIRSSGTAAQTAAGQLQNFHTQAGNAGSAASIAGGKVTSLGGNMSSAGGQAQAAAGQVYALSSAISGLQSKTITITTNLVTTHSARAGGGPVAAGLPYLVGEEGREMFVPTVSGTIVPAPQTERMLSGTRSGSSGDGSGPQVIEVHAELHHNMTLDGQAVANGVQPYVLRFKKRNGYQWSQDQG